jgi:hypothetical protein
MHHSKFQYFMVLLQVEMSLVFKSLLHHLEAQLVLGDALELLVHLLDFILVYFRQ